MTEREALKLALDAFGEIAWSNETQWQRDRSKEAITAIKEALAQLEHEWVRGQCVKCGQSMEQPEQEPVALEAVYETIIQWDEDGGKRSRRELAKRIVSLYTTPPQRTWVGLEDDDEIDWDGGDIKSFVRAIEAKLKEKNT